MPATTTQLENIQSALKYHGSKPGTKSKLVDIGNFLKFHILWEDVTNYWTSNKNPAVISFFFQQEFTDNSDDIRLLDKY